MIVIAFSVDMKLDKISLKMDSDLINTPYLVKLKFLQKQSRYELEHMSRLISSEVDIAVTWIEKPEYSWRHDALYTTNHWSLIMNSFSFGDHFYASDIV